MSIALIISTLAVVCLAVAAGLIVDGGNWIFLGGYFSCAVVTYVLSKRKDRS